MFKKRKAWKTDNKKTVDLYTVAVLKNSTSILQLLKKFDIPAKDQEPMNALDFAVSLNRTECIEIISSTFQRKADFENVSPLIEVQRLKKAVPRVPYVPGIYVNRDAECAYIDNVEMNRYLEELLEAGYDMNSEDSKGITALQLAIYRRDNVSVRTLLQNGANPFLGQSLMKTEGTLRFILELFYCNVNIFDKLLRVYDIASYMFKHTTLEYYRHGPLKHVIEDFIFHCVHSHSKTDLACLNTFGIEEYTKPLGVLCRNSLRRHYGICIHKFVQTVHIPESIRRFLLLEDIIDKFCRKLNWNK